MFITSSTRTCKLLLCVCLPFSFFFFHTQLLISIVLILTITYIEFVFLKFMLWCMLWTFPNFIYFFIYERTVVSFFDGGLPPSPMFLLCRVIDWDVLLEKRNLLRCKWNSKVVILFWSFEKSSGSSGGCT